MRLVLLLLLVLGPLRGALAAAPVAADFSFETHLGAQLPADAAVRDETGRTSTLGAMMGGVPLVLALGYFQCPNVCGVVRNDILSALERSGLQAGRDYRLVVLSIDPNETAEDAARAREGALSESEDPGAEQGWRFLTAPDAGIHAIAQAAGFRYRFDPDMKQFLHPTGVVFATPGGVVSNYLLGVGYTPDDVRGAVRLAHRSAVAAAVSPVLLLCFHFDAETGKWSFAVYRALSVLAALTVLMLGGMLLILHRRDRRGA